MHKSLNLLVLALACASAISAISPVPGFTRPLMCLPKLQVLSPEAETVRKIRLNFYEAGSEWQARVRLQGDRVKAVIFKRGNERPFVSGFVDKDGKGSGYDFRGKLWFFRGFIKD